MAWERLEAMDWLYRSGPDKGKRRLAGLDSGAASSLFLSLERAGCVVEIYHEDVVDYEATAVVLTVPAAAANAAWKIVRDSGAALVMAIGPDTFRVRWPQ